MQRPMPVTGIGRLEPLARSGRGVAAFSASRRVSHHTDAMRTFLDAGHSLLLAQSFAKNFGLYGERVGTLSVACADAAQAARVLSQLKLIIRPMYSSPPIHGALIVSEARAHTSDDPTGPTTVA